MRMTTSPETHTGLQHTLKSEIGCSGTGLHTGETVSILLKPAPANTGIVFRRTDQIGNGAEIPALVENVVEATLCTTLGNEDGVTVATVEHLLDALAGCLIDNVIVEVEGSEIPIMDGSAAPFVFLIECAGVVSQDAPRRVIEVLKRVNVEIDGRQVSLSPGNGFSVGFGIDFDSDAIGRQEIWPLHQRAAELGGSLRTGVEDTFYLPDGERCRGNGDLVAALVQCARNAGRGSASPDEARAALHLN